MDGYLFNRSVSPCREFVEPTTYLEITSLSSKGGTEVVPQDVVHKPLAQEDILDFLSGKGKFAAHSGKGPALLKLVLQDNIENPEAFRPNVLTFPRSIFTAIIRDFCLPSRGIEASSALGHFFWAGVNFDRHYDGPHLQMIFRKSNDHRSFAKRGTTTREWELILSHSFKSGLTTGLYRGTSQSNIGDCIKHLKASARQCQHPLLLPMIILTYSTSSKFEKHQRQAREMLRGIEQAVNFEGALTPDDEDYLDNHGLLNFDHVNRDLSACHAKTMWKDPGVYLRVLDGFERAMEIFHRPGLKEYARDSIQGVDAEILSRMDFTRKKLEGQASCRSAILQRLDVQRSALSISCGQIDNRVSFQLASAQTKLAFSGKREATAQKTIAILGAFFLPGAYVSSLFSMTFFNWQTPDLPNDSHVSPLFWIYWAVSFPFTALVLGSYWCWDQMQSRQARREDELIELQMIEMKRRSQNQAALHGPLAEYGGEV